jgi:hypothetical protein
LLDATGPDHDKLFHIEVVVDGDVLGRGEGPSRRSAETAAAEEALETLRRRRRSPRGEAVRPADAEPAGDQAKPTPRRRASVARERASAERSA